MPEHLECEVLQKERYTNTLTFAFTYLKVKRNKFIICFVADVHRTPRIPISVSTWPYTLHVYRNMKHL